MLPQRLCYVRLMLSGRLFRGVSAQAQQSSEKKGLLDSYDEKVANGTLPTKL